MAGLAHLGVGLAAKSIAPNVNAGVLVTAAYALDIAWGGFFLAGIEQYTGTGVTSTSPYSHGLFMAVVWSVLAAAAARLISRNGRTSLIIGLLVFSHWAVDFIAKPMLHAFPTDTGLPLLFRGSPTVGLGVWSTALGEYIGEYATTLVGFAIYLRTVMKLRKEKKSLIRAA